MKASRVLLLMRVAPLAAPVHVTLIALATIHVGLPTLQIATGIVSGIVRSGQTGPPVASADVRLVETTTGREGGRGRTDPDGKFELRVAPGRYLISASRNGFTHTELGAVRAGLPGAPVVLESGQLVNVELVLQRAAVAAGLVQDARGTVLANTDVVLIEIDAQEGRATRPSDYSARTDPDGRYEIHGVEPGRYVAYASVRGRPSVLTNPDARAPWPAAQFFPGIPLRSQAATIEIGPGEQRSGLDFMLPRVPLVHVTARPRAPDSVTLVDDGAIVIATGVDDGPPAEALGYPMKDGSFVVLMHPGRYRLEARVYGRSPPGALPDGGQTAGELRRDARPYYASAVVDVADVASVTHVIDLTPATRLTGAVVNREGGAVPSSIELVPVSASLSVARPVSVAVDGQGRFSLDVVPGAYRIVIADAGPSWHLESVAQDGRVRTDSIVDAGTRNGAIAELTVVAAASSLSGSLLGAERDAAGVLLALVSAAGASGSGPGPTRAFFTRPDNRGGYLFVNCPAGEYRLIALRATDPPDLRDETFLDSLRGDPAAIAVTLQPSAASTLDLRVGGA